MIKAAEDLQIPCFSHCPRFVHCSVVLTYGGLLDVNLCIPPPLLVGALLSVQFLLPEVAVVVSHDM